MSIENFGKGLVNKNRTKNIILKEIRIDLKNCVDEKYRQTTQKYFKEKIRCYGVRTTSVRKIATKYFKIIKEWNKKEIFEICEELFKTDYNEETTIAIQWITEIKERWEEKDFEKLKKFFRHINNWGNCDDYCLNVLSYYIVKFPKYKAVIKSWTKSDNKWKRRASAVSFIQGGSWKVHEPYIKDVFEVAEKLLEDKEDLVQKGYGWMLKITAKTHQKKVFDFVVKHKSTMPRTSLRYAIEKMPKDMKKEAMTK